METDNRTALEIAYAKKAEQAAKECQKKEEEERIRNSIRNLFSSTYEKLKNALKEFETIGWRIEEDHSDSYLLYLIKNDTKIVFKIHKEIGQNPNYDYYVESTYYLVSWGFSKFNRVSELRNAVSVYSFSKDFPGRFGEWFSDYL